MELSVELQKLLGIEEGNVFAHAEGGWSDTTGIDEVSVGSAFGVNADAIGNRSMDVIELFYEGPVFNGNFTLMIGKMDFAGVFDACAYANDETSQFLNRAFVDNPTIPFADYGLGAALSWNIADFWYLMGGVTDARADGRETGFNTTFHEQDYFLYILETGITTRLDSGNGPLRGTHRIGFWNDPQPKAYSGSDKNYRDDVGLYICCDQALIKENSDYDDDQGLGTFFRYGHANGRKNDLTNFWSAGFQYQGLFDGREDDVLGAGFAQGFFSDKASGTYQQDSESVLEVYYNAQLGPLLNVRPSIEYIANPGGAANIHDAVVLGDGYPAAFLGACRLSRHRR